MDDRHRVLSEAVPAERQRELGDLSGVAARLEGYVSPPPSAAETARLLGALRPLVAARREAHEILPDEPSLEHGLRHWVHLALTQTSLLEPPFWWASAGLFLLGVLVGAVGQGGALALGFVLLAPVLAAAGVAYAFRPAAQAFRDLERAAPIQPLELVYARLGLVLAFNLVLSLGVLGIIWLQEPRVILWRLALLWLGPMLGLAGFALYCAVRWGAVVGAAAPLVLWTALSYGVARWGSDYGPIGGSMQQWADVLLPALSRSNGLLAVALAALVAGVLLLRQGGRLATGEGPAWS